MPLVTEETTTAKRDSLFEVASNLPVFRKEADGQVGSRTYKYMTLDEIMHKLRPVLTKLGLTISHTVETVEGQDYMVTGLFAGHVGSERIHEARCPLLAMSDMQKLGSAITYARRYSICMLFGIVADEDDDASAATESELRTPKTASEALDFLDDVSDLPPPSVKILKVELVQYAKARGISATQVGQLMTELFEKPKLEELTASEYRELLNEIDSRRDSAS